MKKKQLTLSDFAQKEVIRNGDTAQVIFDYYQGDPNKPVRLIGFETEAWKKTFDVQEEAYWYFRDLLENCGAPGANMY